MKKFRLAFLATAALLMAACSSDDLVSKPSVQKENEVPMAFNVGTKNMTRATGMEKVCNDFGVWTYKTTGTADPVLVMNNYKVGWSKAYPTEFANSSTHGTGTAANPDATDGTSFWFYDGFAGQYLKYWDNDADQYDFYAYAPHTTGTTLEGDLLKMGYMKSYAVTGTVESTKVMPSQEATAVENSACKMVAKATRTKASGEFGQDVPLAFTHANAKVRVALYDATVGYRVQINSVTMTQEGDDKIATEVNNMRYTYETGFSASSTDIVTANANVTFAAPEGLTAESEENVIVKNRAECLQAANKSISTTTYYTVPAALDGTQQNGKLTFTVSFTLKALDTDETITTTATATADVGKNDWLSNKVYTYILKITADTLDPIVFDDIQVEDYTNNTNIDVTI